MTLHELQPDLESKLREQSRITGQPLEQLVRQALEEKLGSSAQHQPPGSPDNWLKQFEAWIRSHSSRPGVHLDDSRESIYAGRGE
jgi:hypothetical protein